MPVDDMFEKNKEKLKALAGLGLIFSLGFGCGYYYLDAEKEETAVVMQDKSAECAALFRENAGAFPNGASSAAELPAAENASGTVLSGSTEAQKLFAASKNSTLYHTPDCQYVKRIKEGNAVWFSSAAEAQASGKKPHGCAAG